jgi:parvulin-like peptidyl-prolyl isomerase
MRRDFALIAFSMVLACIVAQAQAGATQPGVPAQENPASGAALTATGVSLDDIVISVSGFCDPDLVLEGTTTPAQSAAPDSSGGAKADCKTEVTRAQFEKLVDAIGPGMDSSNKIKTAVRYAESLVFAQKAREMALDKDPKFQEQLKFGYLQFLSQSFNKYLAKEAANISEPELQTYYKEHPETFEQVDLLRIFVPNEKHHAEIPGTPSRIAEVRAADALAMKAEAERIRRKALAGEDFEKLAVEAYRFAGLNADDAPEVALGKVNRAEVPKDYQDGVFGLKPGQISPIIPAPEGWHICKVLSRQTVPISEAKVLFQRIRLKDLSDQAKSVVTTKFNDAYFNTPRGMEPAKPGTEAR